MKNSSALQRWIFPALIAGITFLVFSPALHNQFINWDDERNLTANLMYRGLSWTHLRWMFSTFLGGPYMPLTWISFAIDFLIWGMNPLGYHLTNIALHALNGCLFYRLAIRLFVLADKRSPTPNIPRLRLYAFLATLAFVIHPLRVESVAWATERKDVLCGFFFLLTLDCYVRNRAKPITLSFFVLALLSKASAMTLPVVFMLLDYYPLRRFSRRTSFVEKIPFIIPAGITALLAAHGQRVAGLAADLQSVGWEQRLCVAAYGAFFYLKQLILPLNLLPIYTAPASIGFHRPAFLWSVLGITALTLYSLKNRRQWPAWTISWLYYLVVLAPVSGLFQSGSQIAADRYTYFPFLAWPLFVFGFFYGGSHERKPANDRVLSTISLLIFCLWGLQTWSQIHQWKDAATLWSYVAKRDPTNAFAYYNLGDIAQKENRLDDANQALLHSLALDQDPAVYYKLGMVAQTQGHESDAIAYFRKTIELKPMHVDAQNALAATLDTQGHSDQATAVYASALQANPNSAALHNNLGALYLKTNQRIQAIAEFSKAAQLDPLNTTYAQNLTISQAQNEAMVQIQQLEALLQQDPKNLALHNQIGVLYLRMSDGVHAEPQFRAMLSLSPTSGEANNNLGIALLMQHHAKEGLRYLESAVRLEPQSDQFRRNRDAALKENSATQ